MKARKHRFNRGFVAVNTVWCVACDKQAYPNRKAALAEANRQANFSGEDLHAYHAPRCHAWHVGHVRPQRTHAR